MRICNTTSVNAGQLRKLIRAVALHEELTPDNIRRFRVTARYRRKSERRADNYPSGYGYYNTWTFVITFVKGVVPDSCATARLIAHELAHCQGVRGHRTLKNSRYGMKSGWRDVWAWAKKFPLSLCEPAAPKRMSRDEKISVQVEHCETMLACWRHKAKLAKTKENFWRRKLGYYQKRRAAAPIEVEKNSKLIGINEATNTEKIFTQTEAAPATLELTSDGRLDGRLPTGSVTPK